MEFHGTRRAPFQMTPGFHRIPWNIPWNSMELCRRQIRCNKVQWNSMEVHGTWWLLIQMKSGNKYFLTYIAEIMPANHAVGSIHIHSNRTMIWQISWLGLLTKGKTIWLSRVIHYIDVIMTTIASQITSLTVVYSTVYSDVDQRKHQSSPSLAFVWGIHRDRWIPRTKGQLRGKCFHLMTSSCFKKSHSD